MIEERNQKTRDEKNLDFPGKYMGSRLDSPMSLILITIEIQRLINIQLAYRLLEGKWQSLGASMGSLRTRHIKCTPIFILYQIARYVNKLNTIDMPRSLTKLALIFLWIELEIEACIILFASIMVSWTAMLRH